MCSDGYMYCMYVCTYVYELWNYELLATCKYILSNPNCGHRNICGFFLFFVVVFLAILRVFCLIFNCSITCKPFCLFCCFFNNSGCPYACECGFHELSGETPIRWARPPGATNWRQVVSHAHA